MRVVGTYSVGHQVDRCVADLVAGETDPDVLAREPQPDQTADGAMVTRPCRDVAQPAR